MLRTVGWVAVALVVAAVFAVGASHLDRAVFGPPGPCGYDYTTECGP